jgi:hypothetical protein
MTWLMQSPLAIVLIGALLCVVMAVAWVSTGRREPLYGLAALLGLTALLLVAERFVITDREAIEATLHVIAADVKSNNRPAVLGHIYSGAPELAQRARAEIGNYEFTECKVTRIDKIEVNTADQPRSAVAEFNVYVSGTFRVQGAAASGNYWRFVHLKLRKEADGRWRVEDYSHSEPTSFLFDRQK